MTQLNTLLLRDIWRPLEPNNPRELVCFETRGTPMHVEITGQWAGVGRQEFLHHGHSLRHS
jgi:hypothetical protein